MTFAEFKKLDVEIHSAAQTGTSAKGIPKWQLNTSEGSWTVQPNIFLNHRIAGMMDHETDDRRSPAIIGKPGRRVNLVHTRDRKVVAIEYAGTQYR